MFEFLLHHSDNEKLQINRLKWFYNTKTIHCPNKSLFWLQCSMFKIIVIIVDWNFNFSVVSMVSIVSIISLPIGPHGLSLQRVPSQMFALILNIPGGSYKISITVIIFLRISIWYIIVAWDFCCLIWFASSRVSSHRDDDDKRNKCIFPSLHLLRKINFFKLCCESGPFAWKFP